jgi:enoyl-CoA hydratase/carnithine racemase
VSSLHEPEDLLAAAHALADRIAANDPRATQWTKRVLRAPLGEHPSAEREAQAELFASPEKRRRMTEFLERRTR